MSEWVRCNCMAEELGSKITICTLFRVCITLLTATFCIRTVCEGASEFGHICVIEKNGFEVLIVRVREDVWGVWRSRDEGGVWGIRGRVSDGFQEGVYVCRHPRTPSE